MAGSPISADAILAEKPDLPVVRGDTPDTWIHGPMSDPAGAKLARNTRPLIAATEALNTQLRGWGVPVPNDAPAIAAAYEQSLLYGEHTWGGGIYWITNRLSYGEAFLKERAAGRFDRLESSWDEHTAYIQKAHQIIMPELAKNLQALAQGVKAEGRRVVVYNPLPWKRSGVVSLEAAGFAPAALKPSRRPQKPLRWTSPPGGFRSWPATSRRWATAPTSPPKRQLRSTLHAPRSTSPQPPSRAPSSPQSLILPAALSLPSWTSAPAASWPATPTASASANTSTSASTRTGSCQWCTNYVRAGRIWADFCKPGQPPV